jgi:RNA polymerase sigma-70 factor, ECF subfamily
MMVSYNDEDLMTATGRGDLLAFEQVVLRYQNMAWRIAYRFLGDASEAEDVTQEAFMKIFKAAPQYRPTAAFKTYFHRVVTSLCIDRIRKKRPLNVADSADVADDTSSIIDNIIQNEREREVRKALGKLPPRQRAAVIFRYFEDLSCREIASVMQTTEKSVERLLSRARILLASRLEHLMKE